MLVMNQDERYFRRVAWIIKDHGWMVQGVAASIEESSPTFQYTVGLSGMAHPEFIIFGLEHRIGGQLLNDLGESVRAGRRFHDGEIIEHLVKDYPVLLIDVRDTTRHLTVANRLYGRPGPVQALQVVFGDVERRWPWNLDSKMAHLPILGDVPEEATWTVRSMTENGSPSLDDE